MIAELKKKIKMNKEAKMQAKEWWIGRENVDKLTKLDICIIKVLALLSLYIPWFWRMFHLGGSDNRFYDQSRKSISIF